MPLYLALLLSLALHTALIAAPTWLAVRQRPAPVPSIEARLVPLSSPTATAGAVSTEAGKTTAAASPYPALLPRTLQGSALHSAQTALSDHLFYPPEAVAQGLEGEVILLLVLSDSGQLVSASVARSSGHALLDQAALAAARSIDALPGNPRQTLFPVSFRLQ